MLVPLISVTAFFVLLLIYTKLAGPIPFSVSSVTTQKTDTFNVTGEGKIIVKPDMAVVNVGIQATGTTVKQVQENINGVISRVSAAIKKLGVDEEDIQTTNYTINPNYDFQGSSQRITGYSAGTNLSIKVKQIDNVNSVIDAATANGANQVGGISFDVDDKTKAENEAREKAVAQAKTKAQQSAKIAGFKLGRIINYSENFNGFPGPIPLRAMAEGSPEIPTQVEPGSSEITIIVTLSYEVL